MKNHALAIFKAALAAVDPRRATTEHLNKLRLPLRSFERVFFVAVGKAAVPMGQAIEAAVGGQLTGGIVLTKYGHGKLTLQRADVFEAAHPIPDEAGLASSQKIEQLLRNLNARDLLITAISGGASALMTAPAAGITLQDKQRTTDLLLRAGADIFELNSVRKHLSRLKGGQMAALAYPAAVVSLLLSDVIGDPIDVIGSGPTAPDNSTFQDAYRVFEKYRLTDKVPKSVKKHLAAGVETPKTGSEIFRNVRNIVIAGNSQALRAAAAKSRALGYRPTVLSSSIQGEAREVGRVHASILRDATPGSCILTGGETIVTVAGKGKGGRNQEVGLALALDLRGTQDVAALCAGTDGTDGPTDAAGAFVTGRTVTDPSVARKYLADNNAYEYLKQRNALVVTGPTGTNVMDINILLRAQKK